MIKILSESENSDGYIISPKGVLLGKVFLPKLILVENKSLPPNKKFVFGFYKFERKSKYTGGYRFNKGFCW